MPAPIRVTAAVVVPASALFPRFVRSSGPGGQNVNKVATKVELRVDFSRVEGLTAPQRARLQALAAARRDAEGLAVFTSQRAREQARNLEDARDKVRALVARALPEPRLRRATRPTAGARAERLRVKAAHARRKRARGRVGADD